MQKMKGKISRGRIFCNGKGNSVRVLGAVKFRISLKNLLSRQLLRQ